MDRTGWGRQENIWIIGPRIWKWVRWNEGRWTEGTERVHIICLLHLALNVRVDLAGWMWYGRDLWAMWYKDGGKVVPGKILEIDCSAGKGWLDLAGRGAAG